MLTLGWEEWELKFRKDLKSAADIIESLVWQLSHSLHEPNTLPANLDP